MGGFLDRTGLRMNAKQSKAKQRTNLRLNVTGREARLIEIGVMEMDGYEVQH